MPVQSPDVSDAAIEAKIFDLLASRKDGTTICPSEVARALVREADAWRLLMPRIRDVAQRLSQDRRLHVTRHGLPVDATSLGGPIRLGRAVDRAPVGTNASGDFELPPETD